MGQPPGAAVAAAYFRLAGNPRAEIPDMRREAVRLVRLAAALPEIDDLIARAQVSLTAAPPDNPAVPCCAWCGISGHELAAEEGFGGDLFCAGTDACVARQDARVPPLPVPAHLAALRDTAESARLELSAMTQAAAAFARDAGRKADEFLMLTARPQPPPARAQVPGVRKRPVARRKPAGPHPAQRHFPAPDRPVLRWAPESTTQRTPGSQRCQSRYIQS